MSTDSRYLDGPGPGRLALEPEQATAAQRTRRSPAIRWAHSSRVTAGSYTVSVDHSDRVRMAVNLNDGCRILNVTEGRRIEVVPRIGAVSILPHGVRYMQSISGIASGLLFEFRWSDIRNWVEGEEGYDPRNLEILSRVCVEDPELVRCLLRLASAGPVDRDEHLYGALDRLVGFHSGRAKSKVREMAMGGLTPMQLNRVLALIDDRLDRELTLDDMSHEVGLSKFHFLRTFRKTTGTTPHRYLLERRLERALEGLLRPGAAVDEVARRTGFSHAGHLSNLLKRRYGVTPSDYRRLIFPQISCGVVTPT